MGAVIFEGLLLYFLPATLPNAVLAFGTTGWLLAFCGLLLYFLKQRKELKHA
jgi:hypothetical protein